MSIARRASAQDPDAGCMQTRAARPRPLPRRFLIAIMAVCAAWAASAAAGPVADAPPDLDLGAIVSDGKALAAEKKAADVAQKKIDADGTALKSDKQTFDGDAKAFNAKASTFEGRCKRKFYEGEQGAVDACAAENKTIESDAAALLKTKAALASRSQEILRAQTEIAATNASLRVRVEALKRRARALGLAQGLTCLNNDALSPASDDIYKLVGAYQVCWDRAAPAPPSTKALPQGTHISANGASAALSDDPGAHNRKCLKERAGPPPPAPGAAATPPAKPTPISPDCR